MDAPDMLNIKDGMVDLASALRSYFVALKRQGFSDSQSLAITISWQESVLAKPDARGDSA